MAVNVCLPLFGSAGQELEEERALQAQHLRTLAVEMHDRLLHKADLLDRLTKAGWTAHTALYDALLFHKQVQTRADVIRHLQQLEIDPEEFMIVEEVEEEDLAEE